MAAAELGDRFTGTELVAGNAAFAIAFGVGGLLGGPVTGGAMDVSGAGAFPYTLTIVFLLAAGCAYGRSIAKQRPRS